MLTFDQAHKAATAATEKAQELGIAVCVSVVDTHGSVIVTLRMDNSLTISPEFATSKALTAAVIGLPTAGIAEYAGEGKPFQGTESAFGGKLMVIAGGLPVTINGTVVGGIGVGGSHDVSQDVVCAEAALAAISA